MKLDAVTDEIQARAEAKADEIIVRAVGSAAAKLEKYRKYKLEMKNLDKLGALSKNKTVVISDDTSNNLLLEVLVANCNKKIMFNLDGWSKSNNKEE
ncbi:hypothetical protein V7S43_004049 [Phytophthora oleae]|uniref:Uncharacterized protein n=1 Tax=Phytophthora oleae TaxID=2107226 RepID=A0ABD3G0Z2_9STRA